MKKYKSEEHWQEDSNFGSQLAEINYLSQELKKVTDDAQNVASTTWRFIDSYEKKNFVDTKGALISVKYYLEKIDYIFN